MQQEILRKKFGIVSEPKVREPSLVHSSSRNFVSEPLVQDVPHQSDQEEVSEKWIIKNKPKTKIVRKYIKNLVADVKTYADQEDDSSDDSSE